MSIYKQIVIKSEEPPEVKGITWQVLRGHSISQLLPAKFELKEFDLPAGAYWRLVVEECGGGMTNTGSATVVCGYSGKPLKPFRTPRKGHLACGTHAIFTCRRCITIDVWQHRGDFDITIRRYAINTITGYVWSAVIWQLTEAGGADASYEEVLESLPNKLRHLRAAIEAAMTKATCYHCREPHYISS